MCSHDPLFMLLVLSSLRFLLNLLDSLNVYSYIIYIKSCDLPCGFKLYSVLLLITLGVVSNWMYRLSFDLCKVHNLFMQTPLNTLKHPFLGYHLKGFLSTGDCNRLHDPPPTPTPYLLFDTMLTRC